MALPDDSQANKFQVNKPGSKFSLTIPNHWLVLSAAVLYSACFIGGIFGIQALAAVCVVPATMALGRLVVQLDSELTSKWKAAPQAWTGTHDTARLVVIITKYIGGVVGWVVLLFAMSPITQPNQVGGAICVAIAIAAFSISYGLRRFLSEEYGVSPALPAQPPRSVWDHLLTLALSLIAVLFH